ncbi:MAG: FecR domain-containing protein [Anaerolineaceae bacterium]|nr:FecR domain-containing protein [Anaerolineaceae bacterium]
MKKILLILLIALVPLIFLAGFLTYPVFSQALTNRAPVEQAPEVVEVAAEPAVKEAVQPAVAANGEKDDEEEDALTAVVEIVEGEVLACGDCDKKDDFCELGEDGIVQEGDVVRTGMEGSATITFDENVDVALEENTQVRIKYYYMNDDDVIVIHLEEIIGSVFFRVDSSGEQKYDFKLITSGSVVASESETYSGKSDVEYEATESLDAEELEEFIADFVCFNKDCGMMFEGKKCANCNAFTDLGDILLRTLASTGDLQITFFDEDGVHVVTLIPNEQFTYLLPVFKKGLDCCTLWEGLALMAEGEEIPDKLLEDIKELFVVTPEPPVITPVPSSCGDGVCDIYTEDAVSCPVDCD